MTLLLLPLRGTANAWVMASETGDRVLRLGEFILENMETILTAWEDYARAYWQGPLPDSKTLRNEAQEMLLALVKDMSTPQSGTEQKLKSEGAGGDNQSGMNQAATGHALARVNDGFDICRMVAEFRALRASVTRIWWKSFPQPHPEQMADMGRFNEALDQLVASSLTAFTARIDRSRRLFLGILGHDLRQPVTSIMMFTEILQRQKCSADDSSRILASTMRCCEAMSSLLSDLLDFTSSQLGTEMPVYTSQMDLKELCSEILAEIRVANPERSFELDAEGECDGEWDARRLRQLVSNLVSNAVQHGSRHHPITLTLRGSAEAVRLSVHNQGKPIPQDAIGTLFDPMVRIPTEEFQRPAGSIGLGLYITKQIAHAHGGKVLVESSGENGTTFTAVLPKNLVPA